jgi:methionine-rich copper-binding protein CopC
MSRKSKSTFTLALLGLLFLPVTPALAHAQITSTSPVRDAVLSEVPAEVIIEFDGNLTVIDDLSINVLKVFNSTGKQIDDGNTLVGGARLTVGITDRTGVGTFRVTYRVVSEDGHPVEGDFKFKVNAKGNSAVPSPTLSAQPAPIAEPEAISATDEFPLDSKSSEHHESFFTHHLLHIIEISAVALLILIWWLFERRRQR